MNTTDLTDPQWARLAPLLPPPRPTGRPRVEDRRTLNGILYSLCTGGRWQDLPPQYGSHATCWRRFAEWSGSLVWEKIWRTLAPLLTEPQQQLWTPAFLSGRVSPTRGGRRAGRGKGSARNTPRSPEAARR